MKSLEEEGYAFIGYIRKSRGKETDDVRVRLLESMATRFTERCPVKAIYASPYCNSMDEIASRDLYEKSQSLRTMCLAVPKIYRYIPKINKIDIVFPFR